MDYFQYKNDCLYAEDIPVSEIAEKWGTPCYIYSRATLERHWDIFDQAFGERPHRVCYAVKANSNLGVLNVLARLGSGFDIVSVGELERVLAAGGDPGKIVFSGVGKSAAEIHRALSVDICCFNVESLPELYRLNLIAETLNKKAPVSIRVNPDINANSHPYISTGLKENKFGIDIADAESIYEEAGKLTSIDIIGVGYHIGSQMTDIQPLIEAFDKVYNLVKKLRHKGFNIRHLDIGGGLGVRYLYEDPPSPAQYIAQLLQRCENDDLELIIEPGRAISANAGILITRIEYIKETQHKKFAVVDAAMNDLIRPALYNAHQEILPVLNRENQPQHVYDIVGPVCETGDFLGKDRHLVIQANDLLAVRTVGAYGFSMSSNYNSRPRVAEIMVDRDKSYLVRKREEISSLFSTEFIIPDE